MNKRLLFYVFNSILLFVISYYYLNNLIFSIAIFLTDSLLTTYFMSKNVAKTLIKNGKILETYNHIFKEFLLVEKGCKKQCELLEDRMYDFEQKKLTKEIDEMGKKLTHKSSKKICQTILAKKEEMQLIISQTDDMFYKNQTDLMFFSFFLGLTRLFLGNCISLLLGINLFVYGMSFVFVGVLGLMQYFKKLDKERMMKINEKQLINDPDIVEEV